MIILWASWCKPCIDEIPEIKKIYEEYKFDNRIHIVSVSLDEKEQNWRKALAKYNMPWQQLWIPKNIKSVQQDLFQFDGSIPTVIFVDKNGKFLKKVVGFDKNNINEYIKVINENIDQ